MINSIENTSKLDRFIKTDGLIVDALLACIFHLFTVVVAFFVDNFTRDAYIPYPVLMTGAIVAITLLVVRRLRAVALVKVLLHVGVVIAYPVLVQLCTGLLTPVSNLVAMIFMLAIHVGYSFFDSFKPRKGLVKPYLVATTVVVNVIVHFFLTAGAYEEYSVDASGLMINVFIAFLLYFIARQICVFEESYRHSLMSSSGPVEQIKKQNNKTIFIVLIGYLIALAVMFLAPTGYFVAIIKNLFSRFMIWLFQRILPEKELKSVPLADEPEEELPEVPLTDSRPIFMYIAAVIAFVVVTMIVVKLVQYALKGRYKIKQSKVVRSDVVTDVIEAVNPKNTKKKKHLDFGVGYEKQIRKKFYTTVRKSIDKGASINISDSPTEIAKAVKEQSGKSIDELTATYEKVRYDKN